MGDFERLIPPRIGGLGGQNHTQNQQRRHGGNHGSCSWGEPRQSLMGETPKTALPPQDRTASPRPHCLPKTALHRCSLLPVPCSLFPVPFAI
ncbi:hypothetical protein [Moorena sp. SIO3E8]|uniref:hypothetical protein n=1 Tax=Moorena sp. SIO3E8 TaxID=2607830 RepID=UPI0025E2A50E|nr:hypothetical protein [Moorena sp. SIO3E8]